MQIVTSHSNLEDIYSTSPKVFIAAKDRNIFSRLNINTLVNVYEFRFDSSSKRKYISRSRENISGGDLNNLNLVKIQLVPNFCLGLIAFSQAGKEELQELIQWWSQSNSPQLSIPPLIELTSNWNLVQNSNLGIETLQAQLWQHLFSSMQQQTQGIAQRIATLQKQYLSLRTLHENMQNAFATVEDYLSQAKLPPLQLTFDNQPVKKLIEPTNFVDSNSLKIKQLLPVSSRGLAMVELHVVKKYDNISGYLTVQLKACEDNTSFAKWHISYQQLPNGWLSLDLPVIDIGRKRDVELIIEWHTHIGPAPALSLGRIQPIPEMQVHKDKTRLERSLAFRLWGGLPGTRKVTSPYLMPIDENDTKAVNLGYLGQGAIAKLREITPNLPTEDFAHIEVREHGAKILTHPHTDGTPTIAMLPFCFPTGANHLTATVATEHEESDIIEYAVAIIKPETDPKLSFNQNSALACSGWTAVEANVARQISLKLNSTVDEHCHIVIAAKLAEGSTPYYAWAHWLNFLVSYQTAESEERVTGINVIKTATTQNIDRVRDASLKLSDNGFARVQEVESGGKIQVHPSYDRANAS